MKTISFIIPIYNEQKRIKNTFKALKKLSLPRGLQLQEVIFVDDGSTDNSKLSLERKLKTKVTLISYPVNKGKGYAIRQGMLASSSDYTLFFDADMSTPLSEINKFLPFINQEIDVIIGTRKNGKSTVIEHQPPIREFLGKCFTRFTQLFLKLDVTDFTCGFKAFSQKAKDVIFQNTIINRWGYDAEVIFLAKKYNLSMIEKAVVWSNDKDSKVKLWKAIPQTLADIFTIHWQHTILASIKNISKNIFIKEFLYE